ncbi:hypothetical protein D3C85_1753330 [compost metagenome]
MIRYSNRAIPQLISAAMIHGLPLRVFRCPYQAKVMKMLDRLSRAAVCIQTGMGASPRNNHDGQHLASAEAAAILSRRVADVTPGYLGPKLFW